MGAWAPDSPREGVSALSVDAGSPADGAAALCMGAVVALGGAGPPSSAHRGVGTGSSSEGVAAFSDEADPSGSMIAPPVVGASVEAAESGETQTKAATPSAMAET